MVGHHWFCQPGKQIRKIPAAIKQQQKEASAPISIVLIKAYYKRSISTAYLEKKNKSRAGLKAVQLQKLFLVFQKFSGNKKILKIGGENMVEEYQGNTYSVMSLVMGILSILLFPLIGWIPGLIGLMVSRRSPGERGESLAVAGRICSIVGISLSAMSIIIVVAGLVLFSFRQGY